MTMRRNLVTSRKIEGRRSRQLPLRAETNRATLSPLMSTTMSRKPRTVATMRVQFASTSTSLV